MQFKICIRSQVCLFPRKTVNPSPPWFGSMCLTQPLSASPEKLGANPIGRWEVREGQRAPESVQSILHTGRTHVLCASCGHIQCAFGGEWPGQVQGSGIQCRVPLSRVVRGLRAAARGALPFLGFTCLKTRLAKRHRTPAPQPKVPLKLNGAPLSPETLQSLAAARE